jgi:hypothetical protein
MTEPGQVCYRLTTVDGKVIETDDWRKLFGNHGESGQTAAGTSPWRSAGAGAETDEPELREDYEGAFPATFVQPTGPGT